MKKPLIIITGPTAVGKTALSLKLAEKVNGEIISADSMQVYKHMDIGTAKLTQQEMQGVKHYLIDEYEPLEEFNVNEFQVKAKQYMQEIYNKGKIPIIVGGTGFYIQSVLYDIDFKETEKSDEYRNKLFELAETKGNKYLHDMLRQIDENAANAIHENNVKRVVRAIEFYNETKTKISEHNQEQTEKESPYNFAYFVLNTERKVLYDRINKRVDIMLEQGLLEEVQRLKNMGCTQDMISMKGIGYRQILNYLDGEVSLEQAIDNIKLDTRHFAKRQLTWFRREKNIDWIDINLITDTTDILVDRVIHILEDKDIITKH